jgi:hypothetical protein
MVDEFLKKEMEHGEARAKEEMQDVLDKTPPLKVEVQKGFDAQGRPVHSALTTLQEVEEEHLYIIYKNPLLHVVIEADLLGDQAVHNSDGKLPPVIHIECPIPSCREAQPDGRSPLSITSGNKHFEIEDLPHKDWGVVTMPDGRPILSTDGKPVIMTRRLTIKETFKCSYCQRRFRLTDNIMSDA